VNVTQAIEYLTAFNSGPMRQVASLLSELDKENAQLREVLEEITHGAVPISLTVGEDEGMSARSEIEHRALAKARKLLGKEEEE